MLSNTDHFEVRVVELGSGVKERGVELGSSVKERGEGEEREKPGLMSPFRRTAAGNGSTHLCGRKGDIDKEIQTG